MGQLNPTRQEIINAHEELEKLCQRLPATRAAKETILRALPPLPRPTMAEVEWDDDKHYLAEAEHPIVGTVIMLDNTTNNEGIKILFKGNDGFHFSYVYPERLTPTGRRYTLTEGE
ncbi:hypothetical protein GWO58_00400 [Corynebacterium macginleyi]|uniref:hypothetical protein n=1 Tax=Corynebacterium macginleyi TaxID=38290 RepID=UPI00190BF331|nr:hypothetical protein [Corynebacterium macginleyi]MBK4145358.1 hypothetical protein [Corynebacterium macginleyi]